MLINFISLPKKNSWRSFKLGHNEQIKIRFSLALDYKIFPDKNKSSVLFVLPEDATKLTRSPLSRQDRKILAQRA